MNNFLSTTYYNNTGQNWLIALTIFVGVFIILKIIESIIISRAKKLASRSQNDFDDTLINIISNIKPPFYFLLALYLAVKSLVLPDWLQQVVRLLFIVFVAYEVINGLQKLIEYFAYKTITRNRQDSQQADEAASATVKTLSVIIKIILWSIGLILILSNIGVNVSSLIAGLGIGGVAVALAVQNILGDIFSSFSILFDKPFKVGDFIIIGNDMGVVEKIGIKTTRITTLQGQQLIVANKELTSTRINNYGRMQKRRVVFELGVIYETAKEKLEKIPAIIKKSIESVEKTEFDRSHFKKYGDFSLIFESVYYVNSADYNEYMDINQQINFKILDAFKKEEVEFAYPTSLQYNK